MTLKQVFIVNSDLKMGKGKIAIQVAHGEVFYMRKKFTGHDYGRIYENYIDWMKDGLMKKVVLKATQEEMLILIGIIELVNECRTKNNIWYDIIFDKTISEIPVKCMTGIVIEPFDEELVQHHFKHLKLL